MGSSMSCPVSSVLPERAVQPLLQGGGLPDFSRIRPSDAEPAIETLLVEARALVAHLASPEIPATWQDFAAPLAEGLAALAWAWGIVGHLHAVRDDSAWRAAHEAILPEISRFYSELGQNAALFAKYRTIRASADFSRLNAGKQRVIDNEIRDFRLSGAELATAEKARFLDIQERLSWLAARFSENVLDATNAFRLRITNEADLAGLPPEVVMAARSDAEAAGETGWHITLRAPSYLPFMQYAENRALRERLYRAYATRAAEFPDSGSLPEWDNTPLIREMLALRQEEARLLGYRHPAEVALVHRMVTSEAEVLAFLRDLAARAKPFAEKDLRELSAFAAEHLGLARLAAWDIAFASERLREARHAFSEQEARRYFRADKVIAGLFNVLHRLYGISILEDSAPVWDEAVRFYRVENQAGSVQGYFYLDLYARSSKRGGAWMDAACHRACTRTGVTLPVAYIVCNFAAPLPTQSATLTHDEVQTLFHEAGHGFHHLLTRVEEHGISGIDGVEWDAVELPSQLMENFCWEWEVLREMTAHVETGASLPHELFDKMQAARNFQSGMACVRQIEFALFDMLFYGDFSPDEEDPLALLKKVREEVAVLIPPDWQRFPQSFSHIFGGGYAAGYYSYKWAEVLSADAYAAFEETGNVLDATTGQRFLDEILAVGGSRPALASFVAFRGRLPSQTAFFRHNGMQMLG
jgi:oligopeptidase A